jgi:hypothetical protein
MDLGVHWRTYFDGSTYMRDTCQFIGCRCFYDGSGFQAEKLYEEFTEHGPDVVWKRLEEILVDTKHQVVDIVAEYQKAMTR